MTTTTHTELIAALESVFGREWARLTESDRALIVRDCTDEGGVDDVADYRRKIGTGNLESYVKCQRVRFKIAARAERDQRIGDELHALVAGSASRGAWSRADILVAQRWLAAYVANLPPVATKETQR